MVSTATDSMVSSLRTLRKADVVPLEALYDWSPTENTFDAALRAYEDSKRKVVVRKVLALPEVAGKDILEQWSVVGDTFPMGCAPEEVCVFGRESFKENSDFDHPAYGSEHGRDRPGCGIANLTMSWIMKENGCIFPEEGLDMFRFHSCYLWHEKAAYGQVEASDDAEMKR